ncbi:MAG: T9SS type A sorting domain-containing protein, partial [Bacteroidota bacterium]
VTITNDHNLDPIQARELRLPNGHGIQLVELERRTASSFYFLATNAHKDALLVGEIDFGHQLLKRKFVRHTPEYPSSTLLAGPADSRIIAHLNPQPTYSNGSSTNYNGTDAVTFSTIIIDNATGQRRAYLVQFDEFFNALQASTGIVFTSSDLLYHAQLTLLPSGQLDLFVNTDFAGQFAQYLDCRLEDYFQGCGASQIPVTVQGFEAQQPQLDLDVIEDEVLMYEWDAQGFDANISRSTTCSTMKTDGSGTSAEAIEAQGLVGNHKLYPNPARDHFAIQSKEKGPHSVRIFDLQGRLLMAKIVLEGEQIAISDLVPGTYVAEVGSGATRIRHRLVVQ